MARAYVCPHCQRKSRIDPSEVNDGVVACPACKAPFALPDSGVERSRPHAETAVIDTRSHRPEPAPAPVPSRTRLPTVILPDAPPRQAPSRARTILLSDDNLPGAATQPIIPPDAGFDTTPSYTLPLGGGPWPAVALAAMAAALTLVALLAAPGEAPAARALDRATAGAALVRSAMLSGAPELGVAAAATLGVTLLDAQAARVDEVPAGSQAARARLTSACGADTPLTRSWVGSPAATRRWGEAPCTKPSGSAVLARSGPGFTLPTGDEATWSEGGQVLARVDILGEPACVSCHGSAARSGRVGTVVAAVPAAGKVQLWLWPLVSALGVGAVALLALKGGGRRSRRHMPF